MWYLEVFIQTDFSIRYLYRPNFLWQEDKIGFKLELVSPKSLHVEMIQQGDVQWLVLNTNLARVTGWTLCVYTGEAGASTLFPSFLFNLTLAFMLTHQCFSSWDWWKIQARNLAEASEALEVYCRSLAACHKTVGWCVPLQGRHLSTGNSASIPLLPRADLKAELEIGNCHLEIMQYWTTTAC